MPALNFQKQFVDKIKSGHKRQTIRTPRKNPIKEGDTLYLYTGMRTKNCEKLDEVICESVIDFKIHIDGWGCDVGPCMVRERYELDKIAREDGFKDWVEMVRWFIDTHRLPFVGKLIIW